MNTETSTEHAGKKRRHNASVIAAPERLQSRRQSAPPGGAEAWVALAEAQNPAVNLSSVHRSLALAWGVLALDSKFRAGNIGSTDTRVTATSCASSSTRTSMCGEGKSLFDVSDLDPMDVVEATELAISWAESKVSTMFVVNPPLRPLSLLILA